MADGRTFPGRVVFDHLPKTGGQAINAWLTEALGAGCVSPKLVLAHGDAIRVHGGLYCVLTGHFLFGERDRLDPRYEYMTCLREPIDRAVSALYFILGNHDDRQLPELREMARVFLDSGGSDVPSDLTPYISNVYVRHFSDLRREGDSGKADCVRRALQAIEEYDVVGVYERMAEFVRDVATLIGLPVPQALAYVNVTKARPKVEQVPENLRRGLVRLNELDLELYAEVESWKGDVPKRRPTVPSSVEEPRWQPYEGRKDRTIVTPAVVVGSMVVRDGHDIQNERVTTFDVDFFLRRHVERLETGIHIYDSDGRWAFGTNSEMLGRAWKQLDPGSYRVSHHVVINLPIGSYTAGFSFAQVLPDGKAELAWSDRACEFEVRQDRIRACTGYATMAADLTLSPTPLASENHVVSRAVGRIDVITETSRMSPGARVVVTVDVSNRSEQTWAGDLFRPVRFSYHWKKSCGDLEVFDGRRSPVPLGGIPPGQTVRGEIHVDAPVLRGRYTLELTLVQENVGWFEEMGLESAKANVEII